MTYPSENLAPPPRRSRFVRPLMASVVLVAALGVVAGAVPATAAAVNLATPQISVTASTSTVVGLQVFANLNLTGGSNPGGTVTFRLFGPSDASCAAPIFTSTVVVSGTSFNSDRYSTTAAGTYRWRVTYNGDANNSPVGPSQCADARAAVIVSPRDVGLSVTAQSPTASTIRAAATLGGIAPTGTVTFYLAPPGDTFCSAPSVFTSAVTINGPGTYTSAPYTPTTTGMYKWRARYSGDQNNYGGTVTACLDPNAAVTVTTLGGRAVASVSPTTLSFSPQTVGTVSPGQTVTVSNTGTVDLQVGAVNLTGANPGNFRAGGACAGAAVAPGATCSLSITYSPSAVGSSTAGLEFTDNADAAGQHVTLNGQADSAPTPAKFTYPLQGQTQVDTTKPFTWTPAPAAQNYFLVLGSQPGGYEFGYWLIPPTTTSFAASGLPSGTIYAVLYTEVNGVWTAPDAISFMAARTDAGFTYPTSGQTDVDTNRPFTWSAVPGAQNYYFTIGTSLGGYDLVNSGVLPGSQLSYVVPALPSGTHYARLYSLVNGIWTAHDISFST